MRIFFNFLSPLNNRANSESKREQRWILAYVTGLISVMSELYSVWNYNRIRFVWSQSGFTSFKCIFFFLLVLLFTVVYMGCWIIFFLFLVKRNKKTDIRMNVFIMWYFLLLCIASQYNEPNKEILFEKKKKITFIRSFNKNLKWW